MLLQSRTLVWSQGIGRKDCRMEKQPPDYCIIHGFVFMIYRADPE